MAEEQGAHRRKMEERTADVAIEDMRRDYSEARFGQTCGLTIVLAMIGAGVWVAVIGHPWPGAALGSGGIGLQLVSLFVKGRRVTPTQPTPTKTAGKKDR